MGISERKQRDQEALRGAILDSARELFAMHGYEAVTMRGVAEKVEYSPTAIYKLFPNKAALVSELCNHDFRALARRMRGAMETADPIDRLRGMGQVYVRFAQELPNHYRFMFMPQATSSPELQEARRLYQTEQSYLMLQQTCQLAIAQRRVRPELGDADDVAQVLWAAVHGLCSLQLSLAAESPVIPWRQLDVLAARMIDSIVRGVER
jgi:AcrR family transcriptional regulator